jgi:hypothetical protein
MNKDVRTVSLPDEAVPLDFIEPFHLANHSASFQKDNCTLGIHACDGVELRRLAQEATVVLLQPNLFED